MVDLYLSKLPPQEELPEDLQDDLWLRPMAAKSAAAGLWYGKQRVGKNGLADRIKEIFGGKVTSHSIRATCATQLADAGVDVTTRNAYTGH